MDQIKRLPRPTDIPDTGNTPLNTVALCFFNPIVVVFHCFLVGAVRTPSPVLHLCFTFQDCCVICCGLIPRRISSVGVKTIAVRNLLRVARIGVIHAQPGQLLIGCVALCCVLQVFHLHLDRMLWPRF